MATIITGSGSYIPTKIVSNLDFDNHDFLNENGTTINLSNEVITKKFKQITGISERRYVENTQVTSDIALIASERAIENSNTNKEAIDYIIVAHNFGDVPFGTIQSDMLPSLATRVKHKLKIKNPRCVAYDIIFGCPGWIEGFVQAHAFIQSGIAKKCLVIGAETLSRVIDSHDRDSMIYSDGAGATIIESSTESGGILSHISATYAYEEANYLFFGCSYNTKHEKNVRYIKMHGRKIYEFALTEVPKAMKECLEKSNISIHAIKKILIHQANEKMDEAIIERFYKLFDLSVPEGIMPMSIYKLGNSSVATIPTLFDLLTNNKIENQELNKGDIIMFASVGAGMNINAMVYQY